MTTEIIEEELGEKVVYGQLPKCSQIDNDEKSRLYEAVLEETQKTDKALHRDFEKNEDCKCRYNYLSYSEECQ